MAATSVKTAGLLKNAVISGAKAKHSATVIFLHGLGDTGNGWCSMLSEFQQPYVKVICPTADIMPVTINGGFRMPSWFDIYSLDDRTKQDEEGIKKAVDKVHELLEHEQSSTGIPSDRIVLGGFSQGGSLAMVAALSYAKPLAGILAMSSWLPATPALKEVIVETNKQTPFLQCHGDADPTVPYKGGKLSGEFIQTFNKSTYEFKTYPGLGHSSSLQELQDVREWLEKRLPPVGGNM